MNPNYLEVIYRTVTSTLSATINMRAHGLPKSVGHSGHKRPFHCACGCLKVIWTNLRSFERGMEIGVYATECEPEFLLR